MDAVRNLCRNLYHCTSHGSKANCEIGCFPDFCCLFGCFDDTVMRILSFLFALMVLLQSTVAAACIPTMGDETSACCEHAKLQDCNVEGDAIAEHDHESPTCKSGCNPFQYCGCCSDAKQAGMISMPLIFFAYFVLGDRQYTANDPLPELITYELRQPPKVG